MITSYNIKTLRKEYKKIGYIECQVFDGEKIYFNNYGFKHLIRKGREMRTPKEIMRRFGLIELSLEILRTSTEYHSHRDIFWSFRRKIQRREITVIIRQLPQGTKHFFSVFDRII